MKSIHLAALAGTAATILCAGCEKKPAGSKVGTIPPTPLAEKTSPAAGTPETAPAMPQEEEAESETAVFPAPDSPEPAQPEPPVGAEAFSSEAARILELPAGPERDEELKRFVRDSMHGGFARTEEWIRKIPAGPTRDTAYSAFIEDLANVAPMLALDYIQRISDPEKRASLEAMLQTKPRLNGPAEPGEGATPVNPQSNQDEPDDSSTPAPR